MLTKPEIEALINELLAANRSPGYGITVRNVASDPPTIDVDLRFLSGHTYCCAEPGAIFRVTCLAFHCWWASRFAGIASWKMALN